MIWQDIVIAAGQWVLAGALIPSIIGHNKPEISTSVLFMATLLVFAVSFATLNLWITAFSTGIGSLMWLVLAVQKYRQ